MNVYWLMPYLLTADLELAFPRVFTPRKVNKSVDTLNNSLDLHIKKYASRIYVVPQ
jgi:hypothetical protein